MMRTRGDERGAVMVLMAVAMTVITLMAAFAVDLGMQRVARRDMQALADAVALDLARLVDGRTAKKIADGDAVKRPLSHVLADSVGRNDDATVGDPPAVTAVLIDLNSKGEPVLDASGAPAPVTGDEVPAAVQVSARTSVGFAFATGEGAASRSAVGQSESIACFRLGSFAAAVSAANSPVLNRYVNDALDLTALSYEGLADATITTRLLATELGVGSVDELVALQGVRLQELFLASATVLQNNGGETADVDLLKTLSTNVGSTASVDIAGILGASTGGASALDTSLNVLDLVAAAAFVSNGTNFLDVPILWKVPQFSTGAVRLQVIERAQRGCGRIGQAKADTAQLRLDALPKLNVPTIAGLSGDPVPVNLKVELAGADGLLTGIACGAGTDTSPESVEVQVTQAADSTISLNIPIKLAGEMKAEGVVLKPLMFLLTSLLGVKAKLDITVNAGLTVTYPASTATGVYSAPPHDYTDPEHVGGSGGIAVPHVTLDSSDLSGTITVNGITKDLASISLTNDVDLSAVLNDLVAKNVLGGINEFIDNVNAELTPLTQLLGIQAAGADLFGIASPTCDSPALRG